LVHALLFLGLILDDAYISFRYARNLAGGHGLTFNPGAAPVEGYTNFSLVAVSGLLARLGIAPEAFVPMAGLACAAGLVVVVARAGRRLAAVEAGGGAIDPLAGIAAASIVAITSGVALYAATGLETVAYGLLLAAAGVALVEGRAIAFAVLTSFAFLTRPEAALLGVVGTGVLLGRRDRRGALSAVVVFAAIVGPYLVFKWIYFGTIVPNTLLAKQPYLAFGLRYGVAALVPPFELDMPRGQFLLAVVAAAALGWRAACGPRRLLLALWGVFAVATVLEGGDWMFDHRFFVPIAAWLALAADARVLQAFRRRRGWDVAVVAALVAYAGTQALHTRAMSAFYDGHGQIDDRVSALAEQLESHGVKSVALLDIGVFSYAGDGLEILDLAGLTDPVVARSPGYHTTKQPPVEYLERRAPDMIVIGSGFPVTQADGGRGMAIYPFFDVERYVIHTEWFVRNYHYVYSVPITPAYWMHMFARNGLPGWGPL
jgi:hypothetical protein